MPRDKTKKVSLSYAGNDFVLRRTVIGVRFRFYTVTEVQMGRGSTLRIPPELDGIPVTGFSLPRSATLPTVRTLVLPEKLADLEVSNGAFPALESIQVSPESVHFSAEGKRLYSRDGDDLYLSFAMDPEEEITIPFRVDNLSKGCFAGTKAVRILAENPDLFVEEGAFEGSAFLEASPVLTTKDTLCALLRPVEFLSLQDGITVAGRNAFGNYSPRVLSVESLCHRHPEDFEEDEIFYDCEDVREIQVRGRSLFTPKDILEWENLERFVLLEEKENEPYETRDGVLYRRDGEELTLVAYPSGRNMEHFQIPEEVTRVGEGALPEVWEVRVTEGTAKGLVRAVYGENTEKWGCRFLLQKGGGEKQRRAWEERERKGISQVFLIPEGISPEGARHLELAWDEKTFDPGGHYAEAFLYTDPSCPERMEMALQAALAGGPEETEHQKAWEEAMACLRLEKRKEFFDYLLTDAPEVTRKRALSLPLFGPEEFSELLALCNERGDAHMAALILARGKERGKRTDFGL